MKEKILAKGGSQSKAGQPMAGAINFGRKNKKGFAGLLVSMIMAIAIIAIMYYLWQKSASQGIQNTVQKAAEEVGVEVDSQEVSPQGQVDAVRDIMNGIQDKKNAEIERELGQ